jgi:hypothetical protein
MRNIKSIISSLVIGIILLSNIPLQANTSVNNILQNKHVNIKLDKKGKLLTSLKVIPSRGVKIFDDIICYIKDKKVYIAQKDGSNAILIDGSYDTTKYMQVERHGEYIFYLDEDGNQLLKIRIATGDKTVLIEDVLAFKLCIQNEVPYILGELLGNLVNKYDLEGNKIEELYWGSKYNELPETSDEIDYWLYSDYYGAYAVHKDTKEEIILNQKSTTSIEYDFRIVDDQMYLSISSGGGGIEYVLKEKSGQLTVDMAKIKTGYTAEELLIFKTAMETATRDMVTLGLNKVGNYRVNYKGSQFIDDKEYYIRGYGGLYNTLYMSNRDATNEKKLFDQGIRNFSVEGKKIYCVVSSSVNSKDKYPYGAIISMNLEGENVQNLYVPRRENKYASVKEPIIDFLSIRYHYLGENPITEEYMYFVGRRQVYTGNKETGYYDAVYRAKKDGTGVEAICVANTEDESLNIYYCDDKYLYIQSTGLYDKSDNLHVLEIK